MSGKRTFVAPTSQDFTISDDSDVIYHVRVKPNGIAIKSKSQRRFKQLEIEEVHELAEQHGKEVKQ